MTHAVASVDDGPPTLVCVCGYRTSSNNDSWAFAGDEMDNHLETANE